MLVSYVGECMVSLTNINSGIKVLIHGYDKNCNTKQILICDEYVKSMTCKVEVYKVQTQVTICINTIFKHIDTMTYLLEV